MVQEEEGVGSVSQYLLDHRIRLYFRRETLIWLRELLVPQEQVEGQREGQAGVCLGVRTLLGHRMWLHFVSANQ